MLYHYHYVMISNIMYYYYYHVLSLLLSCEVVVVDRVDDEAIAVDDDGLDVEVELVPEAIPGLGASEP